MTMSSDINAYEDLRPILDEALASPKGIAVFYETGGKAKHQRQRFYKFRALDRMASRDLYEPGNPLRGTSVYDALNAEYVEFADGKHALKLTHATPLKIVQL